MTEFKDSEGRNWTLNLTLGSAKCVYDKTGVNLLDPSSMINGDDILRLFSDDLFVGKIVWALISKQAEQRNLTEESVLNSFDAETLAKAQDSFLKEYHAFFMARGNLQVAKMIAQTESEVKRVMKDESAGETLSNSQEEQESSIGETIPGTN